MGILTHGVLRGDIHMKMQLALLSLLIAISGAYSSDDNKTEEQSTPVTDENKDKGEEANKDKETGLLAKIFGQKGEDKDKKEEEKNKNESAEQGDKDLKKE